MGLIFIHLNQPEKAIDIYDKMLEIFQTVIQQNEKR